MTSRERLETALRGGTPDRVPVSPFGWGHVNPDSAMGQRMLAELDMILCVGGGGNPFWGAQVDTTSSRDGDATTTIFHTPRGDLRTVHRRTSVTSATTEFLCRTPADLDLVRSLPHTPSGIAPREYHAWVDRAGDEAIVMVGLADAICWPAALFSPEDMCLCWADAPDELVAITNLAQQRLLPYVEALCQAGVRAFRIVGGEYATTQLGPRGFDALVAQQDRELCDLIKSYGGLAYWHNHGVVMPFLEQFKAVAPHAIDPFEAPPYGDCNLREAKRVLGDICLVGNLDDMEQYEQLPHDELRRLAAERLQAAGPTGFVLGGTASGTYTEVGAAGFLAVVEVAEAFRG
ncbi:MAG: hypothetical protein IT204_21820 [Fimbriimonadaceae bacterium]|nr:hypothetical protein [Fimbriimonadaceae bacterium]